MTGPDPGIIKVSGEMPGSTSSRVGIFRTCVLKDFLCCTERRPRGPHLLVASAHARGQAREEAPNPLANTASKMSEKPVKGAPAPAPPPRRASKDADVGHLTLLRVRERFVGDNRLLEEASSESRTRVVGWRLTRELAVRLLDLVLAGASGDAEDTRNSLSLPVRLPAGALIRRLIRSWTAWSVGILLGQVPGQVRAATAHGTMARACPSAWGDDSQVRASSTRPPRQ